MTQNTDDNETSGTERECFKCGQEIRPHHSAYDPWDETFKLVWKAGSDDEEHVEDRGEGGKHPSVQVRQFCSYDCLEAFVQMDYEFPETRSLSAETEQ